MKYEEKKSAIYLENESQLEGTEIAKQDEYDDEEYIYEENMEYEEKKSTIEFEIESQLEQTT